MQSYKTSQVGGRASQVGGIACIVKVNERNLEPLQGLETKTSYRLCRDSRDVRKF